jgi:hypothetical protein
MPAPIMVDVEEPETLEPAQSAAGREIRPAPALSLPRAGLAVLEMEAAERTSLKADLTTA